MEVRLLYVITFEVLTLRVHFYNEMKVGISEAEKT